MEFYIVIPYYNCLVTMMLDICTKYPIGLLFLFGSFNRSLCKLDMHNECLFKKLIALGDHLSLGPIMVRSRSLYGVGARRIASTKAVSVCGYLRVLEIAEGITSAVLRQ